MRLRLGFMLASALAATAAGCASAGEGTDSHNRPIANSPTARGSQPSSRLCPLDPAWFGDSFEER